MSRVSILNFIAKIKISNMRQILNLITQRGGAQAIVFISTIFATKYFLPEDFGLVGLFTSICSFFALFTSLRFEIKALVSKQEYSHNKFISLAYLSNFILFIFFTLISIILYFFKFVKSWVLFIPFGVFFFCLTQYILPAQNSRVQQLKKLGWMTQIIAIITALAQILGALFFPSFWILIIGRLIAWVAGVIFMFESVILGVKNAVKLSLNDIRRMYGCCHTEIFYEIPAALVSVISFQIPAYIYYLYNLNAETGVYWLAFNLLFMPFIIISTSIRPLFIRYLSSNKVENKPLFLKKFIIFSFLGGGAFVFVINFIMYLLCLYYLPEEWASAQSYTLALSLMVITLFSQAGVSFGISIFDLQKINLVSQSLQVFSRILVMVYILSYIEDPLVAIWGYSIISFIGYILYIYYCLNIVSKRSLVP